MSVYDDVVDGLEDYCVNCFTNDDWDDLDFKGILVIDYDKLELHNPVLTDKFICEPDVFFTQYVMDNVHNGRICDDSVSIVVRNFPSYCLGDIQSSMIGSFVGFNGIVKEVGKVEYVCTKKMIKCLGCLRVMEVPYVGRYIKDFDRKEQCRECGGSHTELVENLSVFVPTQRIVIGDYDSSFELSVVVVGDGNLHDFRVGQDMVFGGVLRVSGDTKNIYLECRGVDGVVEDVGVVEDLDVDEDGRGSKEYDNWRKLVMNRDSVCQCCSGDKYLEVHHIFGYKDFPNLRVNVDNGIVLCKWCHGKFHSYYGKGATPLDLVRFVRRFGGKL